MTSVACESIRFSFALRRWGRFAKRPQRRRAKEKRMLLQAMTSEGNDALLPTVSLGTSH